MAVADHKQFIDIINEEKGYVDANTFDPDDTERYVVPRVVTPRHVREVLKVKFDQKKQEISMFKMVLNLEDRGENYNHNNNKNPKVKICNDGENIAPEVWVKCGEMRMRYIKFGAGFNWNYEPFKRFYRRFNVSKVKTFATLKNYLTECYGEKAQKVINASLIINDAVHNKLSIDAVVYRSIGDQKVTLTHGLEWKHVGPLIFSHLLGKGVFTPEQHEDLKNGSALYIIHNDDQGGKMREERLAVNPAQLENLVIPIKYLSITNPQLKSKRRKNRNKTWTASVTTVTINGILSYYTQSYVNKASKNNFNLANDDSSGPVPSDQFEHVLQTAQQPVSLPQPSQVSQRNVLQTYYAGRSANDYPKSAHPPPPPSVLRPANAANPQNATNSNMMMNQTNSNMMMNSNNNNKFVLRLTFVYLIFVAVYAPFETFCSCCTVPCDFQVLWVLMV